jgi:hypothetical protein
MKHDTAAGCPANYQGTLDAARILRARVEELLREWEGNETHLDHRSGLRIAAAQLRGVLDE